MLQNCWQLDGKRRRQGADGERSLALETAKDGAAGRVAKRGEGPVETIIAIVFHMANYCPGPLSCQADGDSVRRSGLARSRSTAKRTGMNSVLGIKLDLICLAIPLGFRPKFHR